MKEDDEIEPFSFERARLLFLACRFSHRVTNAEELLTEPQNGVNVTIVVDV